jgi:hypothetical protein
VATNKKEVKTEEKPKLTMSVVAEKWQALFSMGKDKAYSALGYAYSGSPYVQNQRAKRIISQPFITNRENLEDAITKFSDSERILRETSQSLFANYPMLKLNTMYSNILKYRNYFYSKYTNSSDIKSPAYKKERKKISQWVDLLEAERTFRNIVLKVQKEGKCAYYIRDSITEGSKGFDYVYLQELPSDYFKIVGWNTASNFTISFDFTYFWQMGTSPQQFPPIFSKYYEELNYTIPNKGVNTTISIDPRTLPTDAQIYYEDNKWFYWRTLSLDECFVFSQDETNAWHIPNSIGLFLQARDLQDYSMIQQELLQLPLSGTIMGTMPFNKDSGGTLATDNYGMTTDAFTFFTNMFNEVAPKGVQLMITPATDYKFFTFDNQSINNSVIMTNALQQFNSVAGVGGLNSTTEKPNMAQVKTQQVLEYAYSDRLYKQFEKCINTWWKNKLKLKYEWRFKIKGGRFQDELDFAKVEKGITLGQNYLFPEYLSYFDLTLEDALSLQDEVIESGIYKKFQVLETSFNSKSISKNKNGRPLADESKVESDGTESSIEQGTNTADGRLMSLKFCVECGEPLTDTSHYPFCSEDCALENQERIGRGDGEV